MKKNVEDMSMERDPRFALQLEEEYHQNRLQLSAIDAFLHRVADKWRNSGPRPHNAIPLSTGSRPYLTRRTTRRMEAEESSRARRGLQWHGGLDPSCSAAIDLDSDLD